MAFIRNTVTFYKVPLYVTYVCSQCGCQVVAEHIIKETVYSSGTIWNQSKIREKSSYDAKERMTHKLFDILEERKEGKYRTAKFNCKCGKCGQKEPWSRICYNWLTDLTALFSVIAVLIVVYCLLIKDYMLAAVSGGSLIVLLSTYIAYRIANTMKMEKLTALLPVNSLPAFSQDLDEVLEEAVRKSEVESRELYIDKKLQKKMKGMVNQ